MKIRLSHLLIALVSGWGAGCSGEDGSSQTSSPGALAFQAQVDDGKTLYVEHCATCHGRSGQGSGDGPALVGDDALPRTPETQRAREVEFLTALDVLSWMSENMPAGDPGSLDSDEYENILAFALSANGIELDEPLSAENADAVVLNP